MSSKSISTKLKKARSYETQQMILSEWAQNWQDDQSQVISRLRYAATHDNHGDIMYMIQQLEGMTEKRFTALNNVLRTLSDPDRVLKKFNDENSENEDSENNE